MSESFSPFDDQHSRSRDPSTLAGDDLLPPVEPPSARFILQLFVVPALIVLVVVGIWLVFTWLVHRTTMRPEELIQGLEGSSVARWQRASELADVLRNERFAEFKENPAAAAKLAAVLEREIDAAETDTAGAGAGMADQSVMLRYFLCRALGEFRVAEGIDVLLKAATTNRDPREQMVRRGAIQAIAVRAFHLSETEPSHAVAHPELESTLFALATDEDELVRSETAYALGRIGTPACLARLDPMLDDPFPDARYNAAVALAHNGNAKSAEVLAEMLDPDEMTSVRREALAEAQFFKRSLMMAAALEAVEDLAEQNPAADFSEVRPMLERITQADRAELAAARIRPGIVARARETLEVVRSVK